MRPIRQTISALGSTQVIPMNLNSSPFNVGFGVTVSAGGSLTYKIQHTYDDVFSPSFNPATATWFDHPTAVGKTANFDASYAFPVTGVRLTVTTYASGSATLQLIQAGLSES